MNKSIVIEELRKALALMKQADEHISIACENMQDEETGDDDLRAFEDAANAVCCVIEEIEDWIDYFENPEDEEEEEEIM